MTKEEKAAQQAAQADIRNENGQETEQVATGSTTEAQPAPAAEPAIRDLKAEAEQATDLAIAEPVLRAFETNVLAMGSGLKEASDGRKVIREIGATLTSHVDAAITALEKAGMSGPRLARAMQGQFVPVLFGAGWASAKDLIQRRCTQAGHRMRAPKNGLSGAALVSAEKAAKAEAKKAEAPMTAGSVDDQKARFRAYWAAATPEQKAAIKAVIAEVSEPAMAEL